MATTCLQPNPTSDTGVANVVGNSGRGIINGPPTKRFDFSLFKNVTFGENVKLQLRGEVFNIFNKINFRGITSLAIANLGGTYRTISTVRDPRTIQLGAKLTFQELPKGGLNRNARGGNAVGIRIFRVQSCLMIQSYD